VAPAIFLQTLLCAGEVARGRAAGHAETCAGSPPAEGGQLVQKQSKLGRNGHGHAVKLVEVEGRSEDIFSERLEEVFSTATSYCYEIDSADDCWSRRPPVSTPPCTADSGIKVCKCHSSTCDIDLLDAVVPTTGRCQEKQIYIINGHRSENRSTGTVVATGTGTEVYCADMVKNDEWKAKHLVKWSRDMAAENDFSYWKCWHPNTWHEDKCHRSLRYLGEKCWSGFLSAGACVEPDEYHSEYATSCYKGVCVPYAWARERRECHCSWMWNFLVACSAANDQCGGHACLLSSNGRYYCDYSSRPAW